MQIVFFRHGNALNVFEAKVNSDSERPLSELGEKQVLKSIYELKEKKFTPEIIISSPFKRAYETAKIISKEFFFKKIIFLDSLSNSNDIQEVINQIKDISQNKNTIVIGHQPLLVYLAEKISSNNNLELSTAGFILIEVKENFNGNLIFNYKGGDTF